MRMSLQRRGRKAAALFDRLRRNLVQGATGNSQSYPDVERSEQPGKPKPECGPAGDGISLKRIDQRDGHLLRNQHILYAEVAAAGAPQTSDLPVVMDKNLFSWQHD